MEEEEKKLDPKEMFDAVQSCNIEFVKNLLENGHSLDHKDASGRTLLHYASRMIFNTETIRFLVEEGVDVNAQDNNGNTPYDIAPCYGVEIALRDLGGKDQYELFYESSAVVLDFDQTAADTEGQIVESYQMVPRKAGRREPTREEIIQSLSISRADTIAKFWPDWIDGVREFDRIEKELSLPRIPSAFPGAIDTLIEIKKLFGFLGMVTSRRRESLDKSLTGMLKGTECNVEMFNFIQALDDCEYRKPDPRVFGRVLAEIAWRGLSGRVYYIGDSINDYLATIGTPVVFIAVLTGSTTKEEFKAVGLKAWYIADDLAGALEILKTLTVR